MNKRGQVAIFIIIGVVILFAIVAIFVIRSYVVEREITEVARPIIEDIPSELEPVRVYTENCIQSVGEQALIILGQQGGYIYPELWDDLDFNQEDPTAGDGLAFGDKIKIPYWWYNKEENDQNAAIFASNKPDFKKMQQDLERFLNLELASCLDQYKSFQDLGFEIQESTTETTVSIAQQNVKFLVSHPLDIKKGSTSAKLENFYVEIPVKLKHMYEIAELITSTQQNYSFIEKHTMNLIEIFSGTESDLLPPTSDDTFDSSSSLSWQKQDVIKNLKTILIGYVPFLRFYNSNNYYEHQFPDSEYSELHQRIYNNMVLPLEGAEDLDVRFQYLDDWEMYFDVNSEGETIKPTSVSIDFYIGDFGWQRFNVVYDISYPVFISLNSPDSLEGTGYQFNFALESNIRNNEALKPDTLQLPPASAFQTSLLCNLNQRNSGNVTVRVTDKHTQEPVPETGVFFTVGDENCQIGTTDQNGILKAQFPLAIGGLLTISKNNYLSVSQPFDTFLGQDDSISMEMWQMKEVEVDVIKKKIINCKVKPEETQEECFFNQDPNFAATNPLAAALLSGNPEDEMIFVHQTNVQGSSKAKITKWYYDDTNYEPQDTEQVVVFMERISDNEKQLAPAASVEAGETPIINLAPGTYTLSIQSILYEQTNIPAEDREVDGDEFTAAEMNSSNFMAGGLNLEEPHTITIEPADLYAANTINFYYLYYALPDIPEANRVSEDLDVLNTLEQASIDFKNNTLPIFT